MTDSQRNIELQAKAVAAVNQGRVPEELLAPGFCMKNYASAVADYTYRGAAGWRDWMSDMLEEFTGRAQLRLDQVLSATDEYVMASFCLAGRSARSGAPLSFNWTGVTWFREGRATRAEGFTTREEAIDAVRAHAAEGLARPYLRLAAA